MIKYNDLIHKLIDIQRSESYCSRAFRNDTTRKGEGGGGWRIPPFLNLRAKFRFSDTINSFQTQQNKTDSTFGAFSRYT